MANVPSENVLRVVKSQVINKFKLSNDLYSDCAASKIIFERLAHATKYRGYMQETMQDPFGFLLLSEIQVSLVLQIRTTVTSGVNQYSQCYLRISVRLSSFLNYR